MIAAGKKRKNALMQFMRGYSVFRFSIQFPSLIALLLIQSLPCAQCRPDTTDLMVLGAVSQGNPGVFLEACQGDGLTFPLSNREEDWTGLKSWDARQKNTLNLCECDFHLKIFLPLPSELNNHSLRLWVNKKRNVWHQVRTHFKPC